MIKYESQQQLLRFAFFGGLNACISYLLYILVAQIINFQLAYLIAYAFGMINSYLLNAKFTFKKNYNRIHFLRYLVLYVSHYVFSMMLLQFWVKIGHVNRCFAPGFVILISIPLLFILSRILLRD